MQGNPNPPRPLQCLMVPNFFTLTVFRMRFFYLFFCWHQQIINRSDYYPHILHGNKSCDRFAVARYLFIYFQNSQRSFTFRPVTAWRLKGLCRHLMFPHASRTNVAFAAHLLEIPPPCQRFFSLYRKLCTRFLLYFPSTFMDVSCANKDSEFASQSERFEPKWWD